MAIACGQSDSPFMIASNWGWCSPLSIPSIFKNNVHGFMLSNPMQWILFLRNCNNYVTKSITFLSKFWECLPPMDALFHFITSNIKRLFSYTILVVPNKCGASPIVTIYGWSAFQNIVFIQKFGFIWSYKHLFLLCHLECQSVICAHHFVGSNSLWCASLSTNYNWCSAKNIGSSLITNVQLIANNTLIVVKKMKPFKWHIDL